MAEGWCNDRGEVIGGKQKLFIFAKEVDWIKLTERKKPVLGF